MVGKKILDISVCRFAVYIYRHLRMQRGLMVYGAETRFSKGPITFVARKAIAKSRSSFIHTFLIFLDTDKLKKWLSGLEKFPGLSRNGPQVLHSRAPGFIAFTLPLADFVFSNVPSSNPCSRLINGQLVCLLPVEIFNYVTLYFCSLCFSSMPVN